MKTRIKNSINFFPFASGFVSDDYFWMQLLCAKANA